MHQWIELFDRQLYHKTRSLKSKKIIMLFIFIRHINCRHHNIPTESLAHKQWLCQHKNYSWDIFFWNVRSFVNNWAVHIHFSTVNMHTHFDNVNLQGDCESVTHIWEHAYFAQKVIEIRSNWFWKMKSEQKVNSSSIFFFVLLQLMANIVWLIDKSPCVTPTIHKTLTTVFTTHQIKSKSRDSTVVQ